MKQNVGSLDKGVRLALGLAITVVSMSVIYLRPWDVPATAGVAAGALFLAAVLFVTATAETCPIYSLFGIDTLDSEMAVAR
ncbi:MULTISPECIES: DUF2892 domain-containing protein [Haloferax]|uniref:DUF2892 domain-containing protein n=1 Tax=Haloferax marinum TaxID=2666143 RepID=A0A6A8G4N6_9EURY|nr:MULTISPECIES: DUF2892 domain-containing protein [Haloferax]KAB1196737.1 DUF2892 domain-containing protein [Haloferax sp. CBA1150]MRW95745.1 DUF2892 domain-containing protein [Haloferax marinum]